MKRDMELVRKILQAIEAHEHGLAPRPLLIEGYTEDQIGYHVLIMDEGGLLVAANVTGMSARTPTAIPSRLTWRGHEFLDLSRDQSIWRKATTAVKGLSIAVLTEVLKEVGVDVALGRGGPPAAGP